MHLVTTKLHSRDEINSYQSCVYGYETTPKFYSPDENKIETYPLDLDGTLEEDMTIGSGHHAHEKA